MKMVHRKMVRSMKGFPYMKMVRYLLAISAFMFCHHLGWCQQKNDTIPAAIKGKPVVLPKGTDTLHRNGNSRPSKVHTDSPYKVDSLARKKHDPRKATLYSTFFPGLGQIYNRKYWKLPLVYAAVGIPAYTYFSNRSLYQQCQYALLVVVGAQSTGTINADSLGRIKNPQLRSFAAQGQDNAIRTYRNEYRKDEDYSVLFFLLFWGLQIVDATVDAHLMNFDVSDNLSLRFQEGPPSAPSLGGMPSNTTSGIGLVFDWHKPRYKPIALP